MCGITGKSHFQAFPFLSSSVASQWGFAYHCIAPGLGSSCHKGRRLPWSIKSHIMDQPITTQSEILRKIWREQRVLLQSLVTTVAASYTSFPRGPGPHPGWMTIMTHNLGHLTHLFNLVEGVLILGHFFFLAFWPIMWPDELKITG